MHNFALPFPIVPNNTILSTEKLARPKFVLNLIKLNKNKD